MITSASEQYLIEPMVDEDTGKSPRKQQNSKKRTLKILTSKDPIREVETELSNDNYVSIFETFFRSMTLINDNENLFYITVNPPDKAGGNFKIKMVLTKVSNQLELFPNES